MQDQYFITTSHFKLRPWSLHMIFPDLWFLSLSLFFSNLACDHLLSSEVQTSARFRSIYHSSTVICAKNFKSILRIFFEMFFFIKVFFSNLWIFINSYSYHFWVISFSYFYSRIFFLVYRKWNAKLKILIYTRIFLMLHQSLPGILSNTNFEHLNC